MTRTKRIPVAMRITHLLCCELYILLSITVITFAEIPSGYEESDPSPLDYSQSQPVDSQKVGQAPSDVHSCQSKATPQHPSHKPLPKLDLQFEARIEAKILQKGYTVDVEEYYDYVNNRGVVRRMKGGQASTWLYDFTHFEAFLIVGSSCWLSDLRKESFHFFNFSLSGQGGHIGGVADLFNFGSQYNETYIGGNETVRGIPVDHWTSCVVWERFGTVFTLDYYFSRPEYMTAIGHKQVPVRAVLTGQASSDRDGQHTFNHIYDFTFYRPGPIRDISVFEVPRGTVCTHRSSERHRPDLPDSFQMDVEMVQPVDKLMGLRTYYYDYNLKLSRYDLRPNAKSMLTWGKQYGFRPITLIHDYNTGTQYVIDTTSRNCTVDSIQTDTVDADPRMTDPAHVIMRHGKELFDLDKINFSYQGNRAFREISCEVWGAVRQNWPQDGTNTTVEVYFNKENWTREGQANKQVIVGLWLSLVDSTDLFHSEWVNHIYNYKRGDPNLVNFDIEDCYSASDKIVASITLQASYSDLMWQGIAQFRQAVQLQLSELAGLHPLRVTGIQVTNESKDTTNVQFVILEKNKFTAESDPEIVKTAKVGLESLKNEISENDRSILVVYPLKTKEYIIVKGSLKTNTSESIPPLIHKQTCHNYSSGSMAGLGIPMLLIGFLVGAGLVYYQKTKKRPADIPYRVQD